MALQDDPDAMRERLDALERRIKTLETAPRAGNTSIDRGTLRVLQSGTPIMEAGNSLPVESEGETVERQGLRMTRPTGERAFTVLDQGGDGVFRTVMWDRNDHPVVADDREGTGLAAPFVPLVLVPFSPATWYTTTSASFEIMESAFIYQQHPWLDWVIFVATNGGATAEAQIQYTDSSGLAVVSTFSCGVDTSLEWEGQSVVPQPEKFLSTPTIDVLLRRTNGVGTAFVRTMSMYGRGTPGSSGATSI